MPSELANDRELALETSTCQRTLTASGCLIEVVGLDGRRDGLTDEERRSTLRMHHMNTTGQADRCGA
jgi:hypothetical protein